MGKRTNLWLDGYVEIPMFNVSGKDINISEANSCEENRIEVVTQIAAITRGKDRSNNPKKRYEHLIREAVNNPKVLKKSFIHKQASRVLEFIPVVIKGFPLEFLDKWKIYLGDREFYISTDNFNNYIGRFSYLVKNPKEGNFKIYTNLRTLLNISEIVGVILKPEDIPYNTPEEVKNFKIVKIKAPHFVFDQLYTHTQLSKIAVSERVTCEDDYWLPTDILERSKSYIANISESGLEKLLIEPDNEWLRAISSIALSKDAKEAKEIALRYMLERMSIKDTIKLFKELKYKQEIYNRWSYGLKYKTWYMAGWINDPFRWNHLVLEREGRPDLYKSWVQEATADVAKAIYKLLYEN